MKCLRICCGVERSKPAWDFRRGVVSGVIALALSGCVGDGGVQRLDSRDQARLRHDPSWTREQCEGEISRRLACRRIDPRREGNVRVHYSESFSEARASLSRDDLLCLLTIDELIRGPGVAGELLRQAKVDREDRSREYGGVLDAGGVTAFASDEGESGADRAFVAPRAMFEVDAVAHYHFHAQAENNSEYAGPSAGDLEYAARFGRVCVVFTSVSRSKLDADVYFPSGVVVDLGEVGE